MINNLRINNIKTNTNSNFAGTYQGQWLRGMRHGYGVRSSAPFGMASHNKLSENRMASMTSLNQVCSQKLGFSCSSNLQSRANYFKKMWRHFKC